MQIKGSPHRTVLSCARTVYAKEGLAAFYVSYPTTLTMSVPFTAVQFSVYESLKSLINPDGSYSPLTHCVSGGIAGAVAAAVTTPLDVAKASVALVAACVGAIMLTGRRCCRLEAPPPTREYGRPRECRRLCGSFARETA
jgi:hypothetical protein